MRPPRDTCSLPSPWQVALLAAGLLYIVLAGTAVAQAENPAAVPEMPEVLVTGEQPGPGLWKVRKGDNVMWVLGTIAVLPKHMKWKADGIDKILASSQAILSYPGVDPDADIGPFAVIGLLPSLIGIKKLPDGQTLRDVLSPPIYARWVEQRQKILGDSDRLERLRPFLAIDELGDAAHEQAGLGDDSEVIATVRKMAKTHHLKKLDAKYHFFVKDPKAAIKSFKKASLDENACFSYQLDALQRSLAGSALKANAWARGDVAVLRISVEKELDDPCWQGFEDLAFVKDLGLVSIADRVDDAWLKIAEQALAVNRQSFALLEMSDVLLPNGLLAKLAARGYSVQEP